MVFSTLRRAPAAFLAAAALLASAGRSDAAIVVSISEIGGGSLAVSQTGNTYTASSGSFSNITLTVNSNSATTAVTGSLSTTYNITTAGNLDLSTMPGLTISVLDDAFKSPGGGSGSLTNSVGASTGIAQNDGALGFNQVIASTSVAGTTTPNATAIADATPSAAFTTATVTPLPGNYSIQQLIEIKAIPATGSTDAIADSQTFSGTIGSTLRTNPVPAPAGVVLAALALPVFGLRRVIRRKETV